MFFIFRYCVVFRVDKAMKSCLRDRDTTDLKYGKYFFYSDFFFLWVFYILYLTGTILGNSRNYSHHCLLFHWWTCLAMSEKTFHRFELKWQRLACNQPLRILHFPRSLNLIFWLSFLLSTARWEFWLISVRFRVNS